MIVETLFGASLLVNVSLDTRAPLGADAAALQQMPAREKIALLLPLVRSATDCIIRKVKADPRYRSDVTPQAINALIVDSFPACRTPVRAMIDAHDRMFGRGSGEAFLRGPYLDVLPAAVVQQVKTPR